MTNITSTARTKSYTGNGTAGPFDFSFQINSFTEVKVFVDNTLKTAGVHYNVENSSSESSNINADGTGRVRFTSSNFPTSSQTITIVSNVPLSRTSVYTTGGPITASSLETDFDTGLMHHQQISTRIDRTIGVPESDPDTVSMTLPASDVRANHFLKFDASGNVTTTLTPGDLGVGSTIIFEGSSDDEYETRLTVTNPSADRTWTIPDITDTFVGLTATQTLTNKTLTSPTIAQINATSDFTVDTSQNIVLDVGVSSKEIKFVRNGATNPFGSIVPNSNDVNNLAIKTGTIQVIDFLGGGGGVGRRTQIRGDLNLQNSAPLLTFKNSETNVVDGTVLGTIEFLAPTEDDGFDANEVSASILAEADATFTATVNKTDLVFKLGESGSATEKMRLTHEGNLVISNELSASSLDISGNTTAGGNFTVTGNLTVNGTTTTVNSTTVSVDDPIFTLGGDTAPASNDNKDRGIEFRWHNGSASKVGFFGFDNGSQKFTFIPDANNNSEVFTGTVGTIVADLEGSVTGDVTGNVSGTAGIATSITATANNSTDETVYPTFVDGATGTQGLETDTGLTYNPSTGVLTATQFTGAVTGDVTGNVSGTSTGIVGVTATNAEINKLDGVTATTTELNYLDITTLGTVEASKAVTADANGDLTFPDNEKAIFGTGSDLEILHDGSHSIIRENNGNRVFIQSDNTTDGVLITKKFGTETMAKFIADGGVELNYNNSKKFETTSTGVEINGGILDIKNDGSQSELRLYCESSNAHYASLQAPAHADFSGNITLTLPATTGTLISTANSDAPTTTTSSSDADFVLVDDGGVMKKITPANLGIGGSGTLTVQDEGSALSTEATTLNFVGAGVTASGTGAVKTITISGGGSGSGGAFTDQTWGASLDSDSSTKSKLFFKNDYSNIVIGVGSSVAEPSSSLDETGSGTYNIFMGFSAGTATTTANANILIGKETGNTITTGDENTFIGYEAGKAVNADHDGTTAVGYQAGYGCPNAGNERIVAIGYQAGNRVRGGTVAIGWRAGTNFGYYGSGVGAFNSVCIGAYAGYNYYNYYSDYNTHIGWNAGTTARTGDHNVTLGIRADGLATSTGNAVVVGSNAKVASNSVSIGYQSQNSGSSNSSGMVSIGYQAGYDMDGGDDSVFIGYRAGFGGGTNDNNIGIGRLALYSLSSGGTNVGVGASALYAITTGDSNSALGHFAGYSLGNNTDDNTAVGATAMYNGTENTLTGSNNTCIGHNANPSSTSVSNEITLGDSNVATLRCQVTSITALSDERDKTAIEDLDLGLNFVNAMKPRKFTWNRRDGKWVGKKEVGFIAQELHEVEMDFSSTDRTRLVSYENPSRLEAQPMNTYPILVKAIQELSAKVDSLQAEVTKLKGA